MGLRGRKAKSAEEHIRTGTAKNKKLDARHDAKKISAGEDIMSPVKPYWLTDEADVVWEEIIPRATKMGLVNFFHSELCADYCTAVADKRRLGGELESEGWFTRNCNETLSTNSKLKAFYEAEKRVLKLAEAIGFTPKAMKAMNITIKQEDPAAAKKAQVFKRRK